MAKAEAGREDLFQRRTVFLRGAVRFRARGREVARFFVVFVAFVFRAGRVMSGCGAPHRVPEIRWVVSSSCRCNVPITRPSDSAERKSSGWSTPDRFCRVRAGSTFLRRLAMPSSSSWAGCPFRVKSKEQANRFRLHIESTRKAKAARATAREVLEEQPFWIL